MEKRREVRSLVAGGLLWGISNYAMIQFAMIQCAPFCGVSLIMLTLFVLRWRHQGGCWRCGIVRRWRCGRRWARIMNLLFTTGLSRRMRSSFYLMCMLLVIFELNLICGFLCRIGCFDGEGSVNQVTSNTQEGGWIVFFKKWFKIST